MNNPTFLMETAMCDPCEEFRRLCSPEQIAKCEAHFTTVLNAKLEECRAANMRLKPFKVSREEE